MFYRNLGDLVNNKNLNINGDNMYTTDAMIPLCNDVTVQRWVPVSALMVVLTILCFLRRASVIQILDSSTPRILLYDNHTNVSTTLRIITVDGHYDINMPTMRISQNSDEFVRMVEKFTR